MAQTYVPKKVSLSFNGIPLTGFAKGTFITVSRNSDSFEVDTGSDGEVARVAKADRSGTVKIVLKQTSAGNDVLAVILDIDERTQSGTGVLMGKDASGRTVFLAAEAWVKKPADVTLSDGMEGREWTIETGILEVFVGGN